MFSFFAYANTVVETVENMTNTFAFTLSINHIVNGDDDNSDGFLIAMGAISILISTAKLYLVNKQNVHFAKKYMSMSHAESVDSSLLHLQNSEGVVVTQAGYQQSDSQSDAITIYEEDEIECNHAHGGGDGCDAHRHSHGDAQGHSHGHSHGDSQGHSHGHSHGDAQGHSHGHSHGDAQGHSHGHSHGDSQGHSHRHSHGDSQGHSHGHSHGDSQGHSHGHSHGDSQGHSHGHSHGDSPGHSHGHSHGNSERTPILHDQDHEHAELSLGQASLVSTNFLNHVTNYSASIMSLSDLIVNDLLKLTLSTQVKWAIVSATICIGFLGALARRRNDKNTLLGDMSQLSACGHVHAEHKASDDDIHKTSSWCCNISNLFSISKINAAIEVIASISGNFNYCISSYSLINGSLDNISLGTIIPCAIASTLIAVPAYFTHNPLNDYFKSHINKGSIQSQSENNNSCTRGLLLKLDALNHSADYSTTGVYVLAFTSNKLNSNPSLPVRAASLVLFSLFGVVGSIAPYLNESKAMSITSAAKMQRPVG